MNLMTHTTQLEQPKVSYDHQVELARELITANELYQSTLDPQLDLSEKKKALTLAKELISNTLSVQTKNEQALNLLGRIELDSGNTETAARLMDNAININPNNSQFYINRAYVSLSTHQYDEAESFFIKALRLEKNSAQAYSGIAFARLKTGDFLGSFKRYQSLVSKGYVNTFIKQNVIEALNTLQADEYKYDLEASLLEYYQWDDVDLTKLANMTSSLLVHKYQLRDDTAIIDMDELVADPLLHNLLVNEGMHNHELETLITSLRQHVLFESAQTKNLRDELVPITMSLAIYSATTDYALYVDENELGLVLDLKDQLTMITSESNWNQDDVVGAGLLIAMYESLYNQSFTFKLMKYDVQDWPLATQEVMQHALYHFAEEHLHSFNTFGDNIQSIINIEFKRAWPRWEKTSSHSKTNYAEALQAEIGSYPAIDGLKGKTLNILVYGCGSGSRAITMAQFFENVQITAVDDDRENLLFAQRKAAELNLNNLQFDHIDNLHRGGNTHLFDVIECSEKINHVENSEKVISALMTRLSTRGLLRMSLLNEASREPIKQIRSLIHDRKLAASADNIRHLRHALLAEAGNGFWDEVLDKKTFYSTGGCRDLFFNRWEQTYNLNSIQVLTNKLGLKCLGFADLPAETMAQVNTPNRFAYIDLYGLDEKLFGETYEVYLTQR